MKFEIRGVSALGEKMQNCFRRLSTEWAGALVWPTPRYISGVDSMCLAMNSASTCISRRLSSQKQELVRAVQTSTYHRLLKRQESSVIKFSE